MKEGGALTGRIDGCWGLPGVGRETGVDVVVLTDLGG